MFRTIWDWLEIEETRDRTLIRKAYARQAGKYHPEDTPEEARQLREAYKRALELAAKDKDAGSTDDTVRAEAPATIDAGNEYGQGKGTQNAEAPAAIDAGNEYGQGKETQTAEVPAAIDAGNENGQGKGTQTAEAPAAIDAGNEYGQGKGTQTAEAPAAIDAGNENGQGKGTQKTLPDNADKDFKNDTESQNETQKNLPENAEVIYRYDFGNQGKKYIYPKSTANFDYFHFDESRAKRLGRLEDRLNSLYQNKSFQDPGLWSDAVKKNLTAKDLQDPHVIAAVLSVLTRIPCLNRRLWDIFEKELFGCCGEGAEWIWLKTQFMKMRIENNTFAETRENVRADSSGETAGTDILSGILLFIFGSIVFFFMLYLSEIMMFG